jgi:DGQHR domain-containing protein
MAKDENNLISFGSVSLVRQGEHTFFSLTLPSELLATTCYVVNREEDPIKGFQRELDEKRAREIATYIDEGLGTIPSSVVLSAQEEIDLKYNARSKTLTFKALRKGFLIIDGQHRVYGFTFAKKAFRVPVIIYSGLSKRDESRLFIDINSKQRGVPPELLLDIKKMAEYENDQESFLREIFDLFLQDPSSCLIGKLSASSKAKNKISRVTFNISMRPLLKVFGGKSADEIYEILNSYYSAFYEAVLNPHEVPDLMVNATFFKAVAAFFPVVAPKVKDRYGAIYTVDNFYSILHKVGNNIKSSKLQSRASAFKPLVAAFEETLKGEFEL